MSKTNVTIVKLGGSVITKKKSSNTLNEKNINLLADQISRFYTQIQEKRSGNRVILVHGGGSFGHPIAKKYLIHKGFGAKSNKNKKNHTLLKNQDQILGASKTHRAMQNLNGAILTALLKRKVAAITLEPSSTFLKKENEILWQAQAQISLLLERNIVPVLYGDIIFHEPFNFSILSGDTIIEILSETLNQTNNFQVTSAIFCFDKPGLIDGHGKLLTQYEFSQPPALTIKKNSEVPDVTGGIKTKLESIQRLVRASIDVLLLDGTKKDNLIKALSAEPCIGTVFKNKSEYR